MNKQNGFSLIEVMVTLAIAAIVVSIAVPSYQTSVQNNRKTTSLNELATAFQLARNTAISRRVIVTVCRSGDGATCLSGGGSGDWTQGWMIFTNPNDNASFDGGETLLRVHGALPGGATFSGNRFVDDRVTFSPTGLARTNNGISNGTITHCDSRGAADAGALIISVGGQVRHASGGNIACP